MRSKNKSYTRNDVDRLEAKIQKTKWIDEYGDSYPSKEIFLEAIGAVDDDS